MQSLVICLYDGKLDMLHFAVTRYEMMNPLFLYYFDFTH